MPDPGRRLAAALLILSACGDPRPPSDVTYCKYRAPIVIDGEPGWRAATFELTFERDATNVDVVTYGIDGLVVTTDNRPIRGATYRAGEKLILPVAYAPGPGRSYLVVGAGASYGPTTRLVNQGLYPFDAQARRARRIWAGAAAGSLIAALAALARWARGRRRSAARRDP